MAQMQDMFGLAKMSGFGQYRKSRAEARSAGMGGVPDEHPPECSRKSVFTQDSGEGEFEVFSVESSPCERGGSAVGGPAERRLPAPRTRIPRVHISLAAALGATRLGNEIETLIFTARIEG